jgi:hypothetical protein
MVFGIKMQHTTVSDEGIQWGRGDLGGEGLRAKERQGGRDRAVSEVAERGGYCAQSSRLFWCEYGQRVPSWACVLEARSPVRKFGEVVGP